MKQTFTLLFFFAFSGMLSSQTVADFEEFSLNADEYLNGDDGSQGFSSGNVFLPNAFEDAFGSWTGWAISTVTDNMTPGFANQYSAITGAGFEGSNTFAVSYHFLPNHFNLTGQADGGEVSGLYITNATYTYFSMLDGDSFAKKFGGETGDDPDYYKVSIYGFLDGTINEEFVDVYLADYRFEDNSMDYILDEWTWVDLSSLGSVDSLSFVLESTDVGDFGINTPTYFCIDHVTTSDMVNNNELANQSIDVFPNPVSEQLNVQWEFATANFSILDLNGRLLKNGLLKTGSNSIDFSALTNGVYFLQVRNEAGSWLQKIVK